MIAIKCGISLYSSRSWLGMLPGSWAYVSAGAFGRAIIVSFRLFSMYAVGIHSSEYIR